MTNVKNRKKIAAIIKKRMQEKQIKKSDLVKNTGLSRNTIYTVCMQGGKVNSYNVDALFSICKELDLNIYIMQDKKVN